MSFKETVDADLGVFVNLDEFAEEHTIEGKIVNVVLDNNTLQERSGGAMFDVGAATLLIYAKTDDLPCRKGYGASINVDGSEYLVQAWDEEMGISTITLIKNMIV